MRNLGNKLLYIKRNSITENQDLIGDTSNYDTNSLVNNLQQIVFQIDTAGKWEYLNSTWEQLSEYKISKTLGTYFVEYVHPKDKARVEEYLQNIFSSSNKINHSENIRILSKNDNPKSVVLRATALYENNSINLSGITGTLTEVTEKLRRQELLESKNRSLQTLINNYPGMAYRCRNDQNLSIDFISEACYDLTGYRHEQFFENDKITYTKITHPDDHQRISNVIQNNLKEGEYFELSHRIITSSKSTKWVLNKGKGNFSSSGELLSFEGVLINFENLKGENNLLANQSYYEPHSNILSIDLFMNRLEHAVQKTKSRENYVFSILIISIDQYLQLQDNIGKSNCDMVFSEICRRIFKSLEPSISLCRLQVDQLGILLDSSKYSIKNITAIMSQIQAQVQAPMSIAENEIYVTASIGVVIGNTKYKHNDDVLSDAHDALNRAKSLGGARYELSDLVTHGKAALQTHIETELEQALRQDKFLVYWQPIINLQDNKLIGLEARLIWPHTLRGLLLADQFVPSAEETQLITPLWEWMLKDATRQIENWETTISGIDKISLNIHVTGATLLDTDSILRLREMLLKVKPELCNLVVGVAEDVLLDAPRTTEEMLKPIKGKDIQLLLDSYGSGQTSLTLLRNMPIDLLRLDKVLIDNCVEDEGKLIKAISALAHELNILVIANGVKTKHQLNILKSANVDFAQGIGVSKPIDENAAIEILKNKSSM